jgi:hypothetical protein
MIELTMYEAYWTADPSAEALGLSTNYIQRKWPAGLVVGTLPQGSSPVIDCLSMAPTQPQSNIS